MILTKWFHFLLLTSIVIAGCEGRAIPATQPPTATTVRVVQAAPFPTAAPLQPTVERAIQAIEASPVPTAETPMGCVEEATIPLHTVEATLDYTAHTVAVQQRTRTINTKATTNTIARLASSDEPTQCQATAAWTATPTTASAATIP